MNKPSDPDLYVAFATLDAGERDALLSLADSVGLPLEELPPLRSLVLAVAVLRLASRMSGLSVEAAYQEAAHALGLDPGVGESIARKLRRWHAGQNVRDPGRGAA